MKTHSNTHRYVWALFRYAPWVYLANLALTSVVFTLPMLSGLVVREFLDQLSGQGQTGFGLWSLLALLLAVAAGRWVPIMLVSFLEPYHHFLIQGLLRHNIVRRLLQRPGASPLPGSPGEILNRMRDDVEEADHVFVLLYDLVGHSVMTLVAVTVMLSINPRLTLLIFLPLGAIMLLSGLTRKRLEEYRRKAREASDRVSASMGEIFGSVQAINLAGAEERVVSHFAGLGENRRRWMLKDRFMLELLVFLFDNTANFGTAVIFLAAADSVGTASFTVGDFALFTYYLQFMWEFVSDVGEMAPRYRQVGVAFERLAALLEGAAPDALVEHHAITASLPPVGAEAAPERLRSLEVRGLTCLHPQSGRGVSQIDLTTEAGSLTVITGRVGSGKSTLLRALLGLLPVQGGEIRWNGALVASPAEVLVPPRCAYTAQSPVLFSLSLRENILLGHDPGDGALEDALRSAVLEQDVSAMAHGLETQVGARGVKLSGGQVQRTAAARMFVRQPDLLLFDDLSSALDTETEQQLWERLRQRPGTTCLAVSHRPEALRRADRIIVLKDGAIADQGKLEELLERCPEMQQLWLMGRTPFPETDRPASASYLEQN